MEVLDEKIAMFLAIGYGYGYGDGFGFGDIEDEGFGFCIGRGNGRGNRCGDGFGFGSGRGNRCGDGFGFGSGWGSGGDYGDGYGCAYLMDGGDAYDNGRGIKEFNGNMVYDVDGIRTLIYSVHGNYAKGAILRNDLTLKPCYIAKVNDCFAHGKTLREARNTALGKSFCESPEDQRIDAFLAAHPNKDRKYSYDDLFRWHNILTGSCEMGRREFCQERGITEKDSFTVKEFCEITKDAYGGNIIKQLESRL